MPTLRRLIPLMHTGTGMAQRTQLPAPSGPKMDHATIQHPHSRTFFAPLPVPFPSAPSARHLTLLPFAAKAHDHTSRNSTATRRATLMSSPRTC